MQAMAHTVRWSDEGIPVSDRFNDLYFSRNNGLAETRHVFLGGNDLPRRFRSGYHIAELGFGTGLNFLATWFEWEKNAIDGKLRYTSFEAFPMRRDDMANALSLFPELASQAADLLKNWEPEGGVFELGSVQLTVVIGDARQTVPAWNECADAWYLDGFAPSRNPELWGLNLIEAVFDRTRSGGSCATYSSAGHVRRNLNSAGFRIHRRSGYGRKRHMITGQKP